MKNIPVIFICILFWLSCGGFGATIVCGILQLLHWMPANDSFVAGLAWGTIGTMGATYFNKLFRGAYHGA